MAANTGNTGHDTRDWCGISGSGSDEHRFGAVAVAVVAAGVGVKRSCWLLVVACDQYFKYLALAHSIAFFFTLMHMQHHVSVSV